MALPEVKVNADANIGTNIMTSTPAIIISSLVFINGLVWNDTFKAILDYYIPEKYKNSKNVIYRLIYAFVLTAIIIVVITVIARSASKAAARAAAQGISAPNMLATANSVAALPH